MIESRRKNMRIAKTLATLTWLIAPVWAQTPPTVLEIANSPIPIRVLVRSPTETKTELQAICLFRSSPVNLLHGSLAETNEKLQGLLDRIRKPELFRGELGETLLVVPSPNSFGARKLLIIGLGDSQTFTPQRMQSVGQILYREASNLNVKHPFFAPTILDGGVSKFSTGEVAEEAISGFLRAAATDRALREAGMSGGEPIIDLTYLAGAGNASGTRGGIEKAISAQPRK